MPRRLRRLEERQSSGKKKKDLTLEELQAKLAAAEARRKVGDAERESGSE